MKKITTLKALILLTIVLVILISLVTIVSLNRETIKAAIYNSQKSSDVDITYEIHDRTNGNAIKTLVSLNCSDGIEYVKYPDNVTTLKTYGKRNISIDYVIAEGVNYTFKVKPVNGSEASKTINIEKVYVVKLMENFEEVVYVDSVNGNDTTGVGSKTKPFKTINKVYSSGLLNPDKAYGIILKPGTYSVYTRTICELANQTKPVYFVGDKQNTTLNVVGNYDINSSGGAGLCSTSYSINFVRLKIIPNFIYVRTKLNFYNCVVDNGSATSYNIMSAANILDFYNCMFPKNSRIFRAHGVNIVLTNCYGGFDIIVYGNDNGTLDYTSNPNYKTTTPKFDSTTYEITDSTSVWQGVGYGTNLDDTRANLGTYGGYYSWKFKDDVFN